MRNGAIGLSVFLIAVGAILTYAVEADADGINLDTAGIALMIVGAIGIVASFAMLGGERARVVTRERVVERDDERL